MPFGVDAVAGPTAPTGMTAAPTPRAVAGHPHCLRGPRPDGEPGRVIEDDLPAGTTIDCDVCVVGAGPAGIALALRLAEGTQTSVCLLESGGLAFDPAAQALAVGEQEGTPYYPLHETRIRALGGSTWSWGGICTPLEEVAFLPRSWVADGAWPFPRSALDPLSRRGPDPLRHQPPARREHRGDDADPRSRAPASTGAGSAGAGGPQPPDAVRHRLPRAARRAPRVRLLLHSAATGSNTPTAS